MEEDSSYQITKAANVNGKHISIHNTTRKMFCHVKISCINFRWANQIGPYINKIMLLLFVAIIGFDRSSDWQIKRDHWVILIITLGFTYFYLNYFCLQEEHIICVGNLGIEVLTVYITGRTIEEFIPQQTIVDVVINEVIYKQRFIYVLIILIGNAGSTHSHNDSSYSNIDRVITLFKGTKPRLHILAAILKKIHKTLISDKYGMEKS